MMIEDVFEYFDSVIIGREHESLVIVREAHNEPSDCFYLFAEAAKISLLPT